MAVLSWMYWPLPFLADAVEVERYTELLMGAAVLQGVAFSLGIAAIYLPPALMLRNRIAQLAGDFEGHDEAAATVQASLATHPFDQFRQVAIIVLPTLVSMLPAVKEALQVL